VESEGWPVMWLLGKHQLGRFISQRGGGKKSTCRRLYGFVSAVLFFCPLISSFYFSDEDFVCQVVLTS
jgi:hypothetical protein